MKAIILRDKDEKLIGVSKIEDLKSAGSKFTKVGIIPGPDQNVHEIELSKDLQGLSLSDLYNKFKVNSVSSP